MNFHQFVARSILRCLAKTAGRIGMFENRVVVYAAGVRSYGGISVLQAMIDNADPSCIFIINKDVEFLRYPETVIRRPGGLLAACVYEFKLRRLVSENSIVLAVTNRPLFWKQRAFVVTYLASVFAIEVPDGVPVTLPRKIKSHIQIFLNKAFKRNTDMFLARSEEMVETCRRVTNWRTEYFPFLTHTIELTRSLKPKEETITNARLFYPSDASPHKNHGKLFQAWRILHERGIDVELVVTISTTEASEIMSDFEKYQITPVGYLEEKELAKTFESSNALIFPSLLESFPLAVIEARMFGLSIVASEKRFVREQVDPEESFDPNCEYSIASAVCRFLGRSEQTITRPDITGLFEFLLLEKDRRHITE